MFEKHYATFFFFMTLFLKISHVPTHYNTCCKTICFSNKQKKRHCIVFFLNFTSLLGLLLFLFTKIKLQIYLNKFWENKPLQNLCKVGLAKLIPQEINPLKVQFFRPPQHTLKKRKRSFVVDCSETVNFLGCVADQ